MMESNKTGAADVDTVDALIPSNGPDSPLLLLLPPPLLLPKPAFSGPLPLLPSILSLYNQAEMLLGKRQRPPIKRTTSITEFSVDLEVADEAPNPSDQEAAAAAAVNQKFPAARKPWGKGDWPEGWFPATAAAVSAIVSPRAARRSSVAVETAPFLRSCGLCNRRLAPGRDIFMYRGEIAYCSFECRQQQMNQDEKKEKCSLSSMKDSSQSSAGVPESSGTGETVAAA